MAAQGHTETKTCPKCFAVVKATSEFCPECGATLDPQSEGSDSEVYNELARANLLRNRHQLQEAIDVSLGILRKYPNNATAHTLLGDIYSEMDDLKQAAEWYEMAIDLNPDSASDQLKLQKVRERMANQQSASTAKALGIPQSGGQVYLYIGVAIILLLICSIGAFMMGKNNSKPVPPSSNPFVVPADQGKPDLGAGPNTGVGGAGVAPKPSDVAADINALTVLQTQSQIGSRFLSAVDDPRDASLWLTVRADGEELPEATALAAATEVFNRIPTYKRLVVRVVRARLVEFVGETTSDIHAEATRRLANSPADQIAKEVFSKTWFAKAAPTVPGAASEVPKSESPEPTGAKGTSPDAGTQPNAANPEPTGTPNNPNPPPTVPEGGKGG